MTAEEVNRYLGVLDLRERLMARLAIFAGLRPGEILALRWGGLESDAFVFPSENPGSPLDRRNLWGRAFAPRLETVGLEWASFQVLRKTNASNG